MQVQLAFLHVVANCCVLGEMAQKVKMFS